ncbi:HEAT repeat domain-containing protein [Lentiprolixibacter aurantiacus]|uniref:HEAT repeat domain-containing protein n=1 Tax=Lentiprolixibacter aurantiacus TaxID=2993939 RepID=A0AAE3SPI9_9FLAO|nr:HEAT repeat domain-containing protein [Lentiprolixibacter aurantiacus]MCX2719582.1 HEAT repeat domain-containing protein [Lentiprolixibacter aurantiacus]
MYKVLSTYTGPLQWNTTTVPEDLLWYMTATFLFLTLAYLSSVFYFRNRINNKTSREAGRKKELAPMISKFLFYTEEDPLEARQEYVQLKIQIRQLLKDGLTRTVLSEVLRDLKKDVSGSARKELLNLYSDLGLQENAIKRLRSSKWQVLSGAILELTQMEIKEAYGLIKKHINHRRSVVRKQAQIATVSLKNEGINYFLDSNRYPISEWQQLKLLDVIRHLEGFEPPKFKNWLTSKNTDVVLFALRLIKYYKQNDAAKAIIRLVNHKNQHIRIEAIQCIREFNLQEAVDTLKKAFSKGNEEVKLLILDSIGLLGDLSDIHFLQNIANNSSTHIISGKALSVINTLKPETILPDEGIETTKEIINTAPQDKPENMKQKEKEALSVHLPKPDLPKNPEQWEDFLDPDFEDELIFSQCCLEEFRDLIQEIGEPLLKSGDPGTLPLDFLPLVISEAKEEIQETATPKQPTTENSSGPTYNCDYPLHAEERITREIEALLEIEIEGKPEQEEDDAFNLNFLPILVDDPGIPEEEDMGDPDLRSIEVIAETLRYKVPEAFDRADKPTENYSLQVPPEESFEAVKAIDWSAIASKNLEVSMEKKEKAVISGKLEDQEELYGFSIFQELFRTADTESKLILLDEVLAVGDEKEVYFLKTLSDDPSELVQKKASKILADLSKQLEQQKSKEEPVVVSGARVNEQAVPDVLFELSFEPEEDCFRDPDEDEPELIARRSKQPVEKKAENPGNFLGNFISLTHKILEKVYG